MMKVSLRMKDGALLGERIAEVAEMEGECLHFVLY
jgi:hypothetical protein